MPDSLYMNYRKTSAVGQTCHDIGTNLASTQDQTASGCTAAAMAFPAWETSQAVLQLHSAHSASISTHVQNLHATANGIEGSVSLMSAADAATAQTAGGIVPQSL